MKRFLWAGSLVMAVSLCSQAAFAECADDQEAEAGSIAGKLAQAAVSKVVPITGKQMVNIDQCDLRASGYNVDYKYNFIGADGLYWVEISAKFGLNGANPQLRIVKKSPNLEAAEAKTGNKLASN